MLGRGPRTIDIEVFGPAKMNDEGFALMHQTPFTASAGPIRARPRRAHDPGHPTRQINRHDTQRAGSVRRVSSRVTIPRVACHPERLARASRVIQGRGSAHRVSSRGTVPRVACRRERLARALRVIQSVQPARRVSSRASSPRGACHPERPARAARVIQSVQPARRVIQSVQPARRVSSRAPSFFARRRAE